MTDSPLSLGATLYMPATRNDIIPIALGQKISGLKSMVICLEDAIVKEEIHFALSNVKAITATLAKKEKQAALPMVFIRPRNLQMAQKLIQTLDLSGINGFVLPKFTLKSLPEWEEIILSTHLNCMPTLETKDVFNAHKMQTLADTLSCSPLKKHILALRVGGNDLMAVMGIRRSRFTTLYDGPLAYVLKMLSCTFGASGFALTSPVFELIDNPNLLKKEIEQDILHGFVGKTAIHPTQIEYIQEGWKVEQDEYEEALRIINSTQAVYLHSGAMCEPTTHKKWALNILERSRIFGIVHRQKIPIGF